MLCRQTQNSRRIAASPPASVGTERVSIPTSGNTEVNCFLSDRAQKYSFVVHGCLYIDLKQCSFSSPIQGDRHIPEAHLRSSVNTVRRLSPAESNSECVLSCQCNKVQLGLPTALRTHCSNCGRTRRASYLFIVCARRHFRDSRRALVLNYSERGQLRYVSRRLGCHRRNSVRSELHYFPRQRLRSPQTNI